MKKKLNILNVVLIILVSLIICLVVSFVYRIHHGDYYDLNADYQTIYEPWTNIISVKYDYSPADLDHPEQTELIDNQSLLVAHYSFASQQLFNLLQQGTDATITLTKPDGETFEASLEYHIMLGLVVNSPYLDWKSVSFDDFLDQTLADYPTVNLDTIADCLLQFEHYFIIHDHPVTYAQGKAYTAITISKSRLLQISGHKVFSKTVNHQTLYYIGSYSQAHAPALRRDVYLSIDQINTYLNQMADTDRDCIIIQDPLPDSELAWSNLTLKMPITEYESYLCCLALLILLTLILSLFIVINKTTLPDRFLKYLHLDGDDDESCNPPAAL